MLRGLAVGCGFISTQHFRAWAATPYGNYVAAVDTNEAAARAKAAEFGISNVYTDLRVALEREKPDFVDIMTRPDTHRVLSEMAADAGCHVLCQKPFTATFDEGRAIVDYVESKNRRIMVAEMWRWLLPLREIKKLLDQQVFGKIFACHLTDRIYGLNRTLPVKEQQPYFKDYTKMVCWEMGIHHIDGLRYLMGGDIERVYAVQWKVNPMLAGEDATVAHFHHASGIESFLDLKWSHQGGDPTSPYIHIECDTGTIEMARDWSSIWLRPVGGEPRKHDYTRPEQGYQKAFDGCINDFAESLATGKPFVSDARDNLKTLAATLACYESNEQHQAVRPAV